LNKRTFIKLCSAFVAGRMLSPLMARQGRSELRNWAGNLEYGTRRLYVPDTLDEAKRFVKETQEFKVLGTRHCFNSIADTSTKLLSLRNLDKIVALDPAGPNVTVEAGITYGQLAPYLHSKGFALHNLASLPHISVAGACSTATHGSGQGNGNLSTAVIGLEMLTASGETLKLSAGKDGDAFLGAVVGLGALGVITKITLRLQPTFMVSQYVYEDLPFSQLKENFDKIESSGYSVSLFTDWQKQKFNEVWIKTRVDANFEPRPDFYGAKLATKNLHPIIELSAENCTEQMGVPGPWYERLPHFRMGFTPSAGKELQAEYFVPRRHAIDAIFAVERLKDLVGPQLMISEIRTIDADNLWMSPCYKEPSVAIHFTWKQNWPEVSKILVVIEKELAPYRARPHWGKLFLMRRDRLWPMYERASDFVALSNKLDPQRKFRNRFLKENIFG